ncbi:MAG TPA: peptide chain release factor N(5)-glutamine methyltransferase, partial [Thermus scotoductus]|nr:peptide chain release factor N(5)-glutamine methyltransferase [Thermus scotoductus]
MVRLLRELKTRLRAAGLPEGEALDLLALASGLSR